MPFTDCCLLAKIVGFCKMQQQNICRQGYRATNGYGCMPLLKQYKNAANKIFLPARVTRKVTQKFFLRENDAGKAMLKTFFRIKDDAKPQLKTFYIQLMIKSDAKNYFTDE
ncbi:hypothetical protein FW778_08920 [Ginsengibacter hankyongi]|uniref:Uncharacterized protein n=1 Tax=Ginsengibacter hankyongi TaxID=2607284 RepID=A0A5J5IRE0_9BACT|nr:hypothetical protein [Ginsengibacter hankyongi]KAA9042122.1 hypothetical protein FW778_08920 [Ginsengibacter hankyongi]